MKKSKTVSRRIAMNTKSEALFTMFCNANVEYPETWREEQTLRHTDWVLRDSFCLIGTCYSWEFFPIETQCSFSLT